MSSLDDGEVEFDHLKSFLASQNDKILMKLDLLEEKMEEMVNRGIPRTGLTTLGDESELSQAKPLKEWARNIPNQREGEAASRAAVAIEIAAQRGSSRGEPWLTAVLFGKSGKRQGLLGVDQLVETSERISQKLVSDIFTSYIRLFLLATAKRPDGGRLPGAPPEDRPWAHFHAMSRQFCDAVMAREQDLKNMLAPDGPVEAQAMLIRTLRTIEEDGDLKGRLTRLASAHGHRDHDALSGSSLPKALSLTVKLLLKELFSEVDRDCLARDRPKKKRKAVVDGDVWREFQILREFGKSLKSAVGSLATERRKVLRDTAWKTLGYPLYATVRQRKGWSINMSRMDISMTANGYEIPAAALVPRLKWMENTASFEAKNFAKLAKKDIFRSEERLQLFAAEKEKQSAKTINDRNWSDMKENFSWMSLTITHPVRPFPATEGAPSDEEFLTSLGMSGYTPEDVYIEHEKQLSLHDTALYMLMVWSSVPPSTVDRDLFLASSKNSFRAVHSVALSLWSALRFGLENGDLAQLSESEKDFLGVLRPFQVSAANTNGAQVEMTSKPGLCTVVRLPWEKAPDHIRTVDEEDEYYLHKETRRIGKGERQNCTVFREEFVSREDFKNLWISKDSSVGTGSARGGGVQSVLNGITGSSATSGSGSHGQQFRVSTENMDEYDSDNSFDFMDSI